ncbi:hypothetical protein CMO93_03340 [Candidatus Woesearchaeota archaeon]|nr:hypothetical protein [Candidatus Woesearchaeota archaeon]|tara:strand:+ start:1229 stop:2197 length:969 start_codon:yes stop_codon:yes gene_type:complete
MKKITAFILLAFLSIFLTACQEELPPEPGFLGPIGQADTALGANDYGIPTDPFNENVEVFSLSPLNFVLSPDSQPISLEINNNHEGGYIYNMGYVDTVDGWVSFEFPQETVRQSNWIRNSASTTVSLTTDKIFLGENDVVTYSCKKYDDVWRCGCSNQDGPCNQWMITTYEYNFDLPDEPSAPQDPATGTFGTSADVMTLSNNEFIIPDDRATFEVQVNVQQQDSYIFKEGYYHTKNGWMSFEFTQEKVPESNWIRDSASITLNILSNDIADGDNYIAVYACKKQNDEWKCGCASQDTSCSQWTRQTYTFAIDLPPLPPELV